MEPRNWDLLAKKFWESALDELPVGVMEAPPLVPSPYALRMVGMHPNLRVALTVLMQMKSTIGSNRSQLLDKAKKIMLEGYGIDEATMDAVHIKSVIQWHIVDFRFMYQDPLVSLLQPHHLQLLIQL